MYKYQYPHPAVASDMAIFTLMEEKLRVLAIQRGIEPFRGRWALPGGFLGEEETIDVCATRELAEETGVANTPLLHFGIYSEPDRDPRERVISIAFLACVRAHDVIPKAGSDADRAEWVDALSPPPLAFDHTKILSQAIETLRTLSDRERLVAHMLPQKFTLTQLQAATEKVLGRQLDKRNFRSQMEQQEWLAETGDFLHGQHRPAKLYSLRASGG